MYFLLGLMVLGLAVLAGGQVWAVTGSITSAWLVGGAVFVLLAWLVRGLTKKKRVDRLVGEVQEGLDESEFTTLVPGQNISQDRVQKQVLRQSEQAAYLIRSMLQAKKSGKSGRS
ncbi:MAG: hypothetical protein HOL51_21105 [Gemmatimonadetes bacterium]|jgi:uncharacterized membrane protein|nr:hypothetical protein [Gemmatimonadota bacterium]MBT5450198.1 hypothetical protein [Gemmatimonadota bacterium]MBT6903770.1 hypothetical protein [Gemmatimonadota bacterium]MBT7418475.1 hypothetical protein [Gemmatimonadota bacterium]MBT7548964.1 hypothetical protein [Gemmatimonadota bacterium]